MKFRQRLLSVCLSFPLRAQENRYVGFGNTVPPQKREDDFLNNAMSSLYSVGPLWQVPLNPGRAALHGLF